MLPPINPVVLEQNPKFKALYKDLTTNKLNADCTTKDPKKQRIQEGLSNQLSKARAEAAERSILIDGLHQSSLNATELPVDLREVIQIVCAQLLGVVPEEDHEILQDDMDYFLENIDTISSTLSTRLTTSATHLARIANTAVPPNALPALIPKLPSQISALKSTHSALTTNLTTSFYDLTSLLTSLLSTHRTLLTTLLTHTERTLHGTLARHTRARAEHLATVTQGMALKLAIAAHPRTLANADEQLGEALEKYVKGLEGRRSALLARKTGAERGLRGYERETGVKDLARRWAELVVERQRIGEELERLEAGEN